MKFFVLRQFFVGTKTVFISKNSRFYDFSRHHFPNTLFGFFAFILNELSCQTFLIRAAEIFINTSTTRQLIYAFSPAANSVIFPSVSTI